MKTADYFFVPTSSSQHVVETLPDPLAELDLPIPEDFSSVTTQLTSSEVCLDVSCLKVLHKSCQTIRLRQLITDQETKLKTLTTGKRMPKKQAIPRQATQTLTHPN